MNLKQFKYALVLSETKNFSKAAEELNISQPSLSQYVKKIEKEVGQELFVRVGRNVRLTDVGKAYIDAGMKILDIEHQLMNELTDLTQEKKGTINIGISPYRSVYLMPPVVQQFHKKYPDIKLVLNEHSRYDLIDGAKKGDFDIFITTPPIDETTFVMEPMMYEELLLAVSKESDLYDKLMANAEIKKGKFPAIDINSINGVDAISLGDYMPMRITTEELCTSFNISLNTVLEVRSNEALISHVSSGVGVAIVPDCLSHFDDKQDRIAFFTFKQDVPKRELVIGYRRDQYLSQAIKELIKLMKTI